MPRCDISSKLQTGKDTSFVVKALRRKRQSTGDEHVKLSVSGGLLAPVGAIDTSFRVHNVNFY